MSVKGDGHEPVKQIVSEKYTKNEIMNKDIKTAVKMYSASEYQNGMSVGKMAEFSLKAATCAGELRQCMEEKNAGVSPKINDSKQGYPYDERNIGTGMGLQGPNGTIGY